MSNPEKPFAGREQWLIKRFEEISGPGTQREDIREHQDFWKAAAADLSAALASISSKPGEMSDLFAGEESAGEGLAAFIEMMVEHCTERAGRPEELLRQLKRLKRCYLELAGARPGDTDSAVELQRLVERAFDVVESAVLTGLWEHSERSEQALNRRLERSESRFNTWIENSLVGVCVKQEEQLVYVNQRFAEIFGYPVSELLGKPLWTFLAPEYSEIAKQRGRDRLSGKQPVSQYELRALTKAGEERHLVGWFSIIDHEGSPAIFGNFVDITDRKIAEEALKESEQRFRTLFETARDCIFVKDRSLRYTHANPAMCELFKRSESDIIGISDEDLFGRRAGTYLRQVDSRVLNGESVEAEHTRPVSGVPTTFHDIRVPLRNADGEVVGVYGIARNITERKRGATVSQIEVSGESASPAMQEALAKARAAARRDGIILLLGESGSGKDYLAAYIHRHSPRRDGPYSAMNCAALPPELAESELFGHEPGAFTGAVGRKRGLVELAEGGTLLLNEIGDLSIPLQAKLLTFLDTRSFTRVGGEKTIPVSARILAATNKDLETEVKEGRFREDLYYRINVLSLQVPPLRERKEDIPRLVETIMARLAMEMQLPEVPEMDPGSLEAMMGYPWPGNVRELRNVLERELMLWRDGPLRPGGIRQVVEHRDWTHTVHFPEKRSIHDVTDDVKRSLIVEALRRSGGNRSRAAKSLGITRFSLHRLMRLLGVGEH